MEWSGCPTNPAMTAQRYVQGQLSPEEAARFEEHYVGCPRCGDPLQFTPQFIHAVRRAASRMAQATPRVRTARTS